MASKIRRRSSRKKEFEFRGKKIEELKSLEIREFAKLVKSRPRRFILREFQRIENFVKRAKKRISNGRPVRTHQRDLVIVPEMVGMKIQVYNGKTFVPVEVEERMLGHRLGEFSLTRARVKHSKAGVGATKGTMHKSKK